MGKNKRKNRKKTGSLINFSLPEETEKYVSAMMFFLLAIIFGLSFFEKAGTAGRVFFEIFSLLAGKTVFIIPLILVFSGLAFIWARYEKVSKPLALAIPVLILGISGILESLTPGKMRGGWLGYISTWPFQKFFGFWVTQLIFWTTTVIGGLIFWHLLRQPEPEEPDWEEEKKPSLIRRIFTPSFKVQHVEEPPEKKMKIIKEAPLLKLKKPVKSAVEEDYAVPLDLLDLRKGKPSAGDVKKNSIIIKKTLESFDIPVEMSEVRIGPTVTQYSLKPAEGVKLSKITSLSNDLSLSLAIHPIRIEAPIPGKSLVGVEVPNKTRSFVSMRELMEDVKFQSSASALKFCLGKDASGIPIHADLAKMPHLLVAGSTGSGKTIFLNTLILSLVYNNSPDMLKLLLIDPKRVEFTVYSDLPHLLCPAIVESPRAVNALKWLVEEMKRRFKILAEVKSRNITSYNKKTSGNGKDPLPYIVLVVDELADLMSSKGRDVEASIVRLAQMSRAVGIHLVLATQRPSVEVITGLIKANITSRVTFQVASQVDSRTVIDTAGAEKLLGSGDMLFISNENIKPKRVQAAYVAEKEVRKVIKWVLSKFEENQDLIEEEGVLKEGLIEALDRDLDEAVDGDDSSFQEDSMYEEAKAVVLQYKKASASFLQRRLRVGYARAARLIDMLEERKIVGPSRGAKAREIYIADAEHFDDEKEEDDWQSV